MKNVLIISNNATDKSKLRELVDQLNETLVTDVSTINQAKYLIEEKHISLVLIDFNMLNEEYMQILNSTEPSFKTAVYLPNASDNDSLLEKHGSHPLQEQRNFILLKNGNKRELIPIL